MINDRPIDNPELQAALDEFKEIMQRYGFAGCCMLVAEDEAAFTYGLHAPWSALQPDSNPLGVRFRVVEKELGREEAKRRAQGGVHTICQLADFGEQTVAWMEDFKLILRRGGMNFDHRPFNGRPLPRLVAGKPGGPR